MWGDIAIAFLLAFITSFVFVPYTIKLANKIGALDIPNKRKIHKKPIPRIGGIAVVIGFFVATIYLIFAMKFDDHLDWIGSSREKVLSFLIGAIIVALMGFLDDVYNLRPWQKLIFQIIAALLCYFGNIRISEINGYILPDALSFIITIGWIVGITNAIDLIDGLDGLSSGVTLISCITLLIIFATNYSPISSIIFITALAGAIVGFLPFNIYPAKTFIGDVGAQFLGYALAVISIFGIAKTVTIAVVIAPVIVLGLPIADTFMAIFRRAKNGKNLKAIFTADENHIHHKLMKAGFTQKQAVAILYAVSSALGMIAIIIINAGIKKAISFMIVLAIVIGIGYKEMKKYRQELIKENIDLGLVDKDLINQKKEEEKNKK